LQQGARTPTAAQGRSGEWLMPFSPLWRHFRALPRLFTISNT